MDKRRIILQNFQSPGDIVILAAALRDLHRTAPEQFQTDVRTSCPDLWEHNPYLTSLPDDQAEKVDCHYPLIHRSNTGLWHFIHAFHQDLGERLGCRILPTTCKGDIHLSGEEAARVSLLEAMFGLPVPYWIIVSAGKFDFTAKWWDPARMQAVVNDLVGRMLCVQVGESGHHHPALTAC